jgi:hypothetical protein
LILYHLNQQQLELWMFQQKTDKLSFVTTFAMTLFMIKKSSKGSYVLVKCMLNT